MSDLAATNCGCGNSCGNGSCGNNILFLLLILCACGGCGNDDGCGNNGLFGMGNFGDGGCGCLIWILLLSCICGGC